MTTIHATSLMGNNEVRDYVTLKATTNAIVKAGTFLTLGTDGSYTLFSTDLTKTIDAVLRSNVELGSATQVSVSVCVSGRIGANWVKMANSIANLDTVPSGGTKTYAMLLNDADLEVSTNITNLYEQPQ